MRRERTRWEEDNLPPTNVAAVVAFILIALALAAVIVLAELR